MFKNRTKLPSSIFAMMFLNLRGKIGQSREFSQFNTIRSSLSKKGNIYIYPHVIILSLDLHNNEF